MMIFLRGTNGSGKSTIVRTVMENYEKITTLKYPKHMDKKVPMGYICSHNHRKLFIPGHYQIANGGIDTMPNLEFAYQMISKYHKSGLDTLGEGKNFNDGIQRIVTLHSKNFDVKVLFIDHPLLACIDAVKERGHSINHNTIVRLADKCEKEYASMRRIGVPCVSLPRAEALDQVKQWLGLEKGEESVSE
jgi:hypothetical protein